MKPIYLQCPDCGTTTRSDNAYGPDQCECGRLEYTRRNYAHGITIEMRHVAPAAALPSEESAARLNVAELRRQLDILAQRLTKHEVYVQERLDAVPVHSAPIVITLPCSGTDTEAFVRAMSREYARVLAARLGGQK